MLSKKTLNTLLASAVAVSVAGSAIAHAEGAEKEKCYGVVKAGKNDCAAANGAHACAGSSTTDAGGDEWIALPTGVCERLAGGSVTPTTGAAPAPATEDAPAAEEQKAQ
jgi:uncharacterized membrane protein